MRIINNIIIIGAGNVATSLGMSLKKAGIIIQQVYSRSETTAQTLAQILETDFTTKISDLRKDADLIICSLPDNAIQKIIKEIASRDTLIVHTSGTTPMDIFENRFSDFGVFYPLQTFTKSNPISLKEVPVCIEANSDENFQLLFHLASKLSNKVLAVDSNKRRHLHVAAVFACNFPNFLYGIAENILHSQMLEFDILNPLINETSRKLINHSPEEIQTGPAIRRDFDTISKHKSILKENKDALEIYELITNKIINQKRKDEEL